MNEVQHETDSKLIHVLAPGFISHALKLRFTCTKIIFLDIKLILIEMNE